MGQTQSKRKNILLLGNEASKKKLVSKLRGDATIKLSTPELIELKMETMNYKRLKIWDVQGISQQPRIRAVCQRYLEVGRVGVLCVVDSLDDMLDVRAELAIAFRDEIASLKGAVLLVYVDNPKVDSAMAVYELGIRSLGAKSHRVFGPGVQVDKDLAGALAWLSKELA
jgi:hypothetical protein